MIKKLTILALVSALGGCAVYSDNPYGYSSGIQYRNSDVVITSPAPVYVQPYPQQYPYGYYNSPYYNTYPRFYNPAPVYRPIIRPRPHYVRPSGVRPISPRPPGSPRPPRPPVTP